MVDADYSHESRKGSSPVLGDAAEQAKSSATKRMSRASNQAQKMAVGLTYHTVVTLVEVLGGARR